MSGDDLANEFGADETDADDGNVNDHDCNEVEGARKRGKRKEAKGRRRKGGKRKPPLEDKETAMNHNVTSSLHGKNHWMGWRDLEVGSCFEL